MLHKKADRMEQRNLLQVLKELTLLYTEGELTESEFRRTKELLLENLRQGPSSWTFDDISLRAVPLPDPTIPQRNNPALSAYLAIQTGQLIADRYHLQDSLGQGATGQVFRCYDRIRRAEYALKIIHPHLAHIDELRQRFVKELKSNERLAHPGIVRTYNLEQDPDSELLFYTMEYVKGDTLETHIRRAEANNAQPTFPLKWIRHLLHELTRLLQYIHARGLVYRDLKPSNIMLTPKGFIKLMDVSIAEIMDKTAVGPLAAMTGLGYYMAPEQQRGKGEVRPAADVFSLGVLTYQLLTGELPIGRIDPPSHLWDDCPKEADAVILRAMDSKPERRYPTPRDFWTALSPLLDESINQPPPTNQWQPTLTPYPKGSFDTSSSEHNTYNGPIENIDTDTETQPDLPASLPTPTQPTQHTKRTTKSAPKSNWFSPPVVLAPPTPSSPSQPAIETKDTQSPPTSPPVTAPTLHFQRHAHAPLPPPPEHNEHRLLRAKDGSPLVRMLLIPRGSFTMGSRGSIPLAYQGERPQRRVFLDDYWIAQTPITNRVWQVFLQESQYTNDDEQYLYHWNNNAPPPELLEHPVVYIGYDDILAFCAFYDVDIPSEAQWEKAARGTEGHLWPWGDRKPHPKLCNFLSAKIGQTTPVDAYPDGASPYGLLDCSGNVWELCKDNWNLLWLEEMGEQARNPLYQTPNSDKHTVRGGYFNYHGRGLRCAFRFNTHKREPFVGTRIATAQLSD
jgi:serine/threonine-protein kinase